MMSNPTHQTSIYLVQQTLNFYQGGLWPWPFILLVSCALAYSGRIEKQPALLRQAIKPVIKKYADGIIGAGIDIFLKQGLLFSTVLTIGIITLQIAHVLSQLMQLPALLTFSVHTVIIGTLLLIFVAQNPFIQKLTRKLQSQRYADNKLILIFCLLIIFLLIAFNALLYFVKIYFLPDHTINIPLPAIHNYNHIKLWYLLSFIWWLGVMPLLARTIADIARDRSLRELLSAGLLLPVLLSAGWRLSNHYSADAATVITSLMECQPITLLIGGFSLLSAAYLFSNPHTCNIAAAANTYKPAGHSTLSFLRILWQLCACMLAAYLLTNLNLLTYLGAALTAPIFVTLFFALSAELINLISTEK